MNLSSFCKSSILITAAFITGVLLLAACQADGNIKDETFGTIQIEFLVGGRPVKGNLIVSNGTLRQEFKQQGMIIAKVPSEATYIFDLKLPGDTTQSQITFRDIVPKLEVPEGGTRNIVFHVPHADQIQSFEPVLLIEDKGAKASIASKLEELDKRQTRVRLSTGVLGKSGAQVFVDGIYSSDPNQMLPGEYSCGENCPHVYAAAEYYACKSTWGKHGGVWQANVGYCKVLTSGSSNSSSEFERIPDGMGGVNLAIATENDGVVYPVQTSLRGMGVEQVHKPPFSNLQYPHYLAKTGAYLYSIVIPESVDRKRLELELPVLVEEHHITQLRIQIPSQDLKSPTPVVIADDRLGLPVRTITRSQADKRVSVDIRTSHPDPGTAWVLVPLPNDFRKLINVQDGSGRALIEGQSFAVAGYDDSSAVVIRTQGSSSTYTIDFE